MIEVLLSLTTLVSLAAAGVVGYFCYKLLQKVLFMNQHFDLLMATIEGFYNHLEKFNSIESYSNEPTVVALISHSKDVMSDIEDFFDQVDVKPYEEKEEREK